MPDPSHKLLSVQPSAGYFDLALGDDEEEAPSEQAGTVVAGRYVLHSLLGVGGAGSVWRAEQTRPVRREVAVKIIHRELASQPVSARFNREYQVLARMDHPGIASVLDAGEMADGRPYFAMELVSGEPVTTWCLRHGTPLRERLEIFLQACLAVQHAHQKGILHRDLKPSNVMVTEVNGRPVVKVIDFGIAKALEGALVSGPDVTLRGMVLGTPRYMSPEQAELTGQDVDTRTDVYTLGVLLYELLTGTTPVQEAEEKKASLADLLQQVRSQEIEPPSRRAARTLSTQSAPPGMSARDLRGDLDWITLRALQKDRELRYPAAIALAEDIRRHLRDEPVSAGPPGLGYRAKKWLARHRLGVLSTAAVFGALSAGVAVSWWALDQAQLERLEAQRQKQSAQSEADLARLVSQQLGDMLVNARKHVEAGMNTQILRNLADECAASMSRFAGQPRAEAQLAEQLAQLYGALEEPARAMPWYERHWELLKRLEGENSLAALDALHNLGWRSISLSRLDRTVTLLRQAVKGYESLPDAASMRGKILIARRDLARALSRLGKHDEALRLFADVMREKGEDNPVETAAWLRDQADALRFAGRLDESAVVLRRALQMLPDGEANVGWRAYILSTLAVTSAMREDYDEALKASQERVDIIERQGGTECRELLKALIDHAILACKCPGCPGGEEAARQALAMAQQAGHESRLADAWTMVSECLRVKGLLQESEDVIRQGMDEVGKTKAERWRLMEMHRRLGDLLTARQAFSEALEEYQTAFKDWFAPPVVGRAREKEELIFTSIILFWELAAEAGSPIADSRQLKLWQDKHAAWAGERSQTVSKMP